MVSPQVSSQDERLLKDVDVHFELIVDAHDGQHVVPVVLECQCQQLGIAISSDQTANADVEAVMGALDEAKRSVVLVLRDDAYAEGENYLLSHLLSLSESSTCAAPANNPRNTELTFQLNLQYQDTNIEAEGHLSAFSGQNIDESHRVLFTFVEPDSMKARMVLQLIKICQMKADLDAHQVGETCDMGKAAKRWTDCFAENFAKNFDGQLDQNL